MEKKYDVKIISYYGAPPQTPRFIELRLPKKEDKLKRSLFDFFFV